LSRIVIVVGYKADKLRAFINGLDIKTPIAYVENNVFDKTNNIYSLYLARDYLREQDTLLLESDLVFDDCVLQDLVNDPHPSLALVAKYESWMDGAVVTLWDDGRIKDFLPKEQFQYAEIKSYFKTVNMYKFSQAFSEQQYIPFLEAYCRALGNNEYYEQVLKVIIKLDKSELKAKILEKGNWYEIDDMQDLDIAESIFTPSPAMRLERLQKRYGGYWRYPQILDFCYLVNPFFPPQKLLDEIKANFEALAMQYPSGQRVNNLLAAKHFGVSPSLIATGNGAAELIKSLLEQIAGKIGVIVPTFEEYPQRKNQDVIAFAPDSGDFSYSAREIMGFFAEKAISALVVINPDNPSGNYIPHDDIIGLAEWAQAKGIRLIIDESFVDFANIDDTLLKGEILARFPSLAVIKSISKAYGVPGLRLGVLACGDADFLALVKNDLPVWNINSFAEFYLQICEKYQQDFIDAMDSFYPVRNEFFTSLKKIPFLDPLPSYANYFTCRVVGKYTARALTEALLIRHNILIKDLSGKGGITGEYVRIAVKKPLENAALLAALGNLGK
jgi:histidinol-phosphate/aromatic aminotransferase/cobyric acid decarboxylase-like protein/choline kinase